MAIIRPCADLRNKYNEISKICHQTNEPVFITKNGYNDLVIMSDEAYEKYEEDRFEKLMSERFEKKYKSFEEFKADLEKHIDAALEDIKQGRCRPAEEVFKELEAKYNL